MAAGLVKAHEGHRFVYLHLLCQGFENIGKALLLLKDDEKYGPMLQPTYGHNLETLLAELKTIYGQDLMSNEASADAAQLNAFYKKHQLRYGDKLDFAAPASTLQADSLHTELVSLLGKKNEVFALLRRDA